MKNILVLLAFCLMGFAPAPLPKKKLPELPIKSHELVGSWRYQWEVWAGNNVFIEEGFLTLNADGTTHNIFHGKNYRGTWRYNDNFLALPGLVNIKESFGADSMNWYFTPIRKGRRLIGDLYQLSKE